MTQLYEVHPQDPQPRILAQVDAALESGAVIAYPTDSGYCLGCVMGLREPLKRIEQIRQVDKHHNFTLMCRDLSEIANYAKVDNPTYRMLKKLTPGGFTFILQATHQVPKLVLHPKKKTIGIRVPAHAIPQALSESLGHPLLSSTLILPGENEPLTDAHEVDDALANQVDIILDAGSCGFEPTTVVDCTHFPPAVLRQGSGDFSEFS